MNCFQRYRGLMCALLSGAVLAAPAAAQRSASSKASRSSAPREAVDVTPGGKVVQYAEKDVIRVKAKLRYTTLIILPKDEHILDFTCGDKEYWVVNGVQNLADLVRKGSDSIIPWDINFSRQTVRLREPVSQHVKLEYPARPMLGCIGVAAPDDWAPTSGPAGAYGGNLDYNRMAEGVVAMFPVYHPGALLYLGDGHALMGDGEPTGTGSRLLWISSSLSM